MSTPRIYLCGPIHGRSDDDCIYWRQLAAEFWPADRLLDPMRRDARARMHEPGIEAEVVEADKRDIDESAGVLVFFDQPSVGTSMEILYAWQMGKPVVLMNASGRPSSDISLWLRYHCTSIVLVSDSRPSVTKRAMGEAFQQLQTLLG